MNITIRPAVISDLKTIQHLNRQLCVKEYQEFDRTIASEFPLTPAGEEYFHERITDGHASVAVVEGNIVGYLLGGIAEKEAYRNVVKLAELENMFIMEAYRGAGIGKQLIAAFSQWCKEQGVTRLCVIASCRNTRAIDFYKREGFDEHDVTLEKEI